jgi:autophagy-related protein 18
MHLTRNLAGSVGGYLPSGLTEMWDPQRDFAHVKLRGAGGIRCVAAMSGYVSLSLAFFFFFFFFFGRSSSSASVYSKLNEFIWSSFRSRTTPQIYVLSSAGLFHVYNIDLERGGECLLLREFR